MLVRKQILLEEQQALDLAEIAVFYNSSMSKKAREMFAKSIKTEKMIIKRIKKKKKMSGVGFLTWLAEHPVHGPGNSEYDKYAYDF